MDVNQIHRSIHNPPLVQLVRRERLLVEFGRQASNRNRMTRMPLLPHHPANTYS